MKKTTPSSRVSIRAVWRLLIIAGAALLLLAIAVALTPENRFDEALAAWLRTLHTPTIIGIAESLSMLFDGVIALVIAIAISIAVLFVWDRRAALFLFVTVMGGYAFVGLIKILIDRPRPPLPVFLFTTKIETASFPSGHAAFALLLFGALWWLVRTRLTKASTRLTVLTLVVALILLFGLARLALGVHWASDVIGGYLAGLLILSTGILWYEGEFVKILSPSPTKTKSLRKKIA